MKLKSLKNKIFGTVSDDKSGNGLFATPEELIAQKQYISGLKNFHRRMVVSSMAGNVRSALKGRGIEMEEIRAYAYGDDVRDIDWRVTARRQTPYTRLYAEEKDREVYVLLDLSPYMAFGTRRELKSVTAAKIAALIGWLCLENKDRFGLLLFNGQNISFFKQGSSRAGILAILKKISTVTQRLLKPASVQNENLNKALKMMENYLKNRATVFVVSDFNDFNHDIQKSLAQLSRRFSVFCIDVYDVLEDKAPPAGEYMAIDGGQRLVFESGKLFRGEYHAYFAARRDELQAFCRKFGAGYAAVCTGEDLYAQLKIF